MRLKKVLISQKMTLQMTQAYEGWYTVPDANVEIHYQMQFSSLSDPNAADFILGDISSTTEGCQVARSFGGTRVD